VFAEDGEALADVGDVRVGVRLVEVASTLAVLPARAAVSTRSPRFDWAAPPRRPK
jgi:hypothetical protein